MSVVWKVHLEFEEDSSSKFWRARIDGKTLYVNYGRIGTTGQMSMKELASPDAAQKELEKLEREKRKKGYQDAGSAGSGEEGGDDEEDGKDEEGEDEEGEDEEGEDDDEEAATPKKKGAKASSVPSGSSAPSGASARLVLSGKGRSIETLITLEGSKVRVEADESYDSADKAKRAFERLKQALLDDGYKEK
jgi:predicted DNA-binding WGR domain protein